MASCSYAWNVRWFTFRCRCGKALVSVAVPPWAKDTTDGKGQRKTRSKSSGGSRDTAAAVQPAQPGKFAKRQKLAKWRVGKEDSRLGSADLLDALVKQPGFAEEDLATLRAKLAPAEPAAPVEHSAATWGEEEKRAFAILEKSTLAGSTVLAQLSAEAKKRAEPKELSVGQLDQKIAHKQGTLAKAEAYVAECEVWIAEANRQRAETKDEAAARKTELHRFREARQKSLGPTQHGPDHRRARGRERRRLQSCRDFARRICRKRDGRQRACRYADAGHHLV